MFVDLPLARCLERAEGLVGASFVDARQSTEVEWRELGGAIVNFDGVADAHAEEGSGDLIVEGPVGVGGAVGELTDDFSRFEVNAHNLWFAVTERTG